MDQKEKTYSILDELSNCSGFDIALMTTFNFEISFFERAVLNRLYAKDVKKVSVFVDSEQLSKALQEFDIEHSGSHIGRKYMVNPVKMNASFHPKVILLLGEKKAKLFVGSANIKTSGYATNNEIFNFIDYTPELPQYLDSIVAAIDFFQKINELSYGLDNTILKEAMEYAYYHKTARNPEFKFIHNMDFSMLRQVCNAIDDEVKEINIAVPYYDKELVALKEMQKEFPAAKFKLYIQNENSTFPKEYNDSNKVVNEILVFSNFKDNLSSSSGNFYHGKVLLFKTDRAAYILYGSSNCTQAAITKAYIEGGNVECDFFEKGDREDFDYFFENMNISESETLVSRPMVYESKTPVNFAFKYGEADGDITLHIAYNDAIKDIKVAIGDNILEYEYCQNELIATVSEAYRDVIAEIFDVTIMWDAHKENVRCWSYSPAILANNREKQSNCADFSDFDMESSGDKYLEDRLKFFKAEATCLSEWQEYKKNQKYMNQIKMEQEGDSGEAEDFIVDFQIPDEYRYAYRQYNAVAKIRSMFVRRFLGVSFIKGVDDSGEHSPKKYDVEKTETEPKKPHKATSAEKSFERFIKGKVKGMLNDVYVEVIELEHYIGLVQVVLDIFDKYNDEELVEDIFQPSYVKLTKILFLQKILSKSFEKCEDKDAFEEALIDKCFAAILENYLYYRDVDDQDERMHSESQNRSFLLELEKRYNLRQNYASHIHRVIKAGKGGVLTLGYDKSCQYIEKLYGYKNFNMLCEFICEQYPNAQIERKGSSMHICVETENIREYRGPNEIILKEIASYSRNVDKISRVYVEAKNVALNLENKNRLESVKLEVNLEYHNWRSDETMSDGTTYNSGRPQFISY